MYLLMVDTISSYKDYVGDLTPAWLDLNFQQA